MINAQQRQDLLNARIVTFLYARIAEIQHVDPDGAGECRQVIDDCCDHINVSRVWGEQDRYILGAVNHMKPLLKLARNWADHPDFLQEWSE